MGSIRFQHAAHGFNKVPAYSIWVPNELTYLSLVAEMCRDRQFMQTFPLGSKVKYACKHTIRVYSCQHVIFLYPVLHTCIQRGVSYYQAALDWMQSLNVKIIQVSVSIVHTYTHTEIQETSINTLSTHQLTHTPSTIPGVEATAQYQRSLSILTTRQFNTMQWQARCGHAYRGICTGWLTHQRNEIYKQKIQYHLASVALHSLAPNDWTELD